MTELRHAGHFGTVLRGSGPVTVDFVVEVEVVVVVVDAAVAVDVILGFAVELDFEFEKAGAELLGSNYPGN